MYVLFMCLGFSVASSLFFYLLWCEKLLSHRVIHWWLTLSLVALLGSKIGHVLWESHGHLLLDGTIARGALDVLKDDPWHWARLFDPGHVLYGGILAGMLAAYVFPNSAEITDALAPAIPLGIGIGRIGCFISGCCYGIAGYPVQIIEAFLCSCLCVLLLALHQCKRMTGQLYWVFLVGYGSLRFGLEFLRADEDRGIWWGLSTGQWISIGVCLLAWRMIDPGLTVSGFSGLFAPRFKSPQ